MKKPEILLTEGRVNFAGNDYLGMAREPRLAEAIYQTALKHGVSPTSSRWGLGWTEVFENLECKLASFFGSEDSCIIGAAYLGGMIYFGSVASDTDIVLIDETSHVNLYKGIKAAELPFETYKHLDVDDLAELLIKHSGKRIVVASDGLWGISGEIPPLNKIVALAKQYNARVLVDDAHGVFHMGANGRGAAEYTGVKPGDATILGSMSKALGCGGGFLAGEAELVDRFRRNDNTSGTSTSAIPVCGAALEAVKMLEEDPNRKIELDKIAHKMREILASFDIYTVDENSHIIALNLKDEFEAQKCSDVLLEFDLVAPYFKYASEPRHNFLRLIAKSSYTDENLETFEKALKKFRS